MAVYKYNPKKLTLQVGDDQLSGKAAGVFLRTAREDDRITATKTIEDTILNVVSNNNGTISIVLHDGSPDNELMEAKAELDANGWPQVFRFEAKDPSGNDVISASKCWVRRPADDEKAAEAGANEWLLGCHDLTYARKGLGQL